MPEDPDELTSDEALDAILKKFVDLDEVDTTQELPWTIKGMVHVGTRALLAGPKGEGKSLASLIASLDVASQGDDFEVYYLDAENGRYITTSRRNAILADRSPDDAKWVGVNFHYIDTFDFRDLDDPMMLAEWQKLLVNAALVVVDSLPKYLGKLGLNENEAPAIAQFVTRYIDPLIVNRRTSVLMLDNTGHDGRRARGSTAKEDMADTVYTVSGGQTCLPTRKGTITMRNRKHRIGDEADLLAVGAGAGTYTRVAPDDKDAKLLEEVRPVMTTTPQTKSWVYAQAKEAGVKVRKQDLYSLLDVWADDPYSEILESDDNRFG
ncbi:MAG TPA: AAA family ATPase, partial [Solirubrobacteraceae bacterium]